MTMRAERVCAADRRLNRTVLRANQGAAVNSPAGDQKCASLNPRNGVPCQLPEGHQGSHYSSERNTGDWSTGLAESLRIATPKEAPNGCQCVRCQTDGLHDSDCAVHNEPAFPAGECDCSRSSSGSEPDPWPVLAAVEQAYEKGNLADLWEIEDAWRAYVASRGERRS